MSARLLAQNVFTVATRGKEGPSAVYQSIRFTNGVWALAELTFQSGNTNIKVRLIFLKQSGLLKFYIYIVL